MGQLDAFLVIAIVVIVTPGQDTALVIRDTLMGGRRSGIFTTVGVVAGQATWTVATSVGVAALLVASEPAFVALKLLGAAYLVLLGVQALRGALSARRSTAAVDASPRRIAPAAAFRQGLISNLGNPKVAVFFSSLLPQFTPHGSRLVRRAARARPRLLLAHARLADDLRGRRRPGRRRPAPAGGPPPPRGPDGRRAGRARPAPGRRASLTDARWRRHADHPSR